ncbi:GNAT family N-acetyltransferase [Roseibium sp.]|uniref:GNAT family N-acetyltransferase n=1 Tax=Roseibium sp. TaxID=1936156 RepID=UPI003A96FF68
MNVHTPAFSGETGTRLSSLVRPLASSAIDLSARWTSDDDLQVLLEASVIASCMAAPGAPARLGLTFDGSPNPAERVGAVLVALEAFFARDAELVEVQVDQETLAGIDTRSLAFLHLSDGKFTVSRSGFYQTSSLWLGHPQAGRTRAGLVPGPDGRDHPLRPPHPDGLVYQRYDPVADVTVSFRAVDIDRDLDTFHRWMNDGRVAYFWELAQPKEELRSYLEQLQAKPHTYPLIGAFDGQDAGYFETYWVREDRLGPYYDSGPWDRGWHGLIGERRHLGRVKTGAWLRGLAHYLFLDCPMTENIMGEPRVDNAKLLTYADALAYEKVKEFDFPHKRSALMRCRRDRFFAEVRL